jgi:hypothetical protein
MALAEAASVAFAVKVRRSSLGEVWRGPDSPDMAVLLS